MTDVEKLRRAESASLDQDEDEDEDEDQDQDQDQGGGESEGTGIGETGKRFCNAKDAKKRKLINFFNIFLLFALKSFSLVPSALSVRSNSGLYS